LLLAHKGETIVLGLPGCARSPKMNGIDWVLERIFVDIEVTREDIMRMGTGGLLKEMTSRPAPREADAPETEMAAARAPKIGAVVLAAGRSRRMGKVNKLLAEIDGKPMVVHAVEAAIASTADPVVVVLGHEAHKVRDILSGYSVTFVENQDYAAGLSSSLKRGLEGLPADVDGAVVCLGDMPAISPAQIDKLISAYDPVEGRAICVPTFNGKRGNPVLWDRRYFKEMERVSGDVGARHLIGENEEFVCEVAIPTDSVLVDLDTPEALAAYTSGDRAEP
jgi:molybdenum cofactor cytidylyltransferase